jgi:hypothetical protein
LSFVSSPGQVDSATLEVYVSGQNISSLTAFQIIHLFLHIFALLVSRDTFVPTKILLKVGFLERDFERDQLAEKSYWTKMGQKIHCAYVNFRRPEKFPVEAVIILPMEPQRVSSACIVSMSRQEGRVMTRFHLHRLLQPRRRQQQQQQQQEHYRPHHQMIRIILNNWKLSMSS